MYVSTCVLFRATTLLQPSPPEKNLSIDYFGARNQLNIFLLYFEFCVTSSFSMRGNFGSRKCIQHKNFKLNLYFLHLPAHCRQFESLVFLLYSTVFQKVFLFRQIRETGRKNQFSHLNLHFVFHAS